MIVEPSNDDDLERLRQIEMQHVIESGWGTSDHRLRRLGADCNIDRQEDE